MIYFGILVMFSVGFVLGAYLRGIMYEQGDWIVLRWSKETLGYRPVPNGTILKRGDRVVMGKELPTDLFPDDGFELVS